ncbi:MAG TPA: hypothetical protein VL921_13640 [Candidatus Udaeobacter sp.]|jgi:hypothetical protein|nr:hypothetical protein [Candidatus Udaeobacter sp.]
MKGKVKRWTVMLLTGVIVMAYAPVGIHAASIAPDADVETIAVPIYNWGFENNEVEGSTVANSVYPNNSEGKAELHAGASVVQDEERGRVLSLPGGQAGSGGWFSLPISVRDKLAALTLPNGSVKGFFGKLLLPAYSRV